MRMAGWVSSAVVAEVVVVVVEAEGRVWDMGGGGGGGAMVAGLTSMSMYRGRSSPISSDRSERCSLVMVRRMD